MADLLFHGSWYSTWQNVVRTAAEEVEHLDRRVFSDPSLAGHLEKIAKKYSFEVARVNKAGVRAKRRETERQGPDAWGDHRTFKQTWLDVMIPFTGDAESFKIAPSSCTIPSYPASIGQHSLTLSIPDDDNAQRAVDTFLDQVIQNLDRLRAEYEQSKPLLEQTINQVANRRKQQIEADRERDKKFSFPIDE